MSPYESFQPQAESMHADASTALLGDTWAKPQPTNQHSLDNSDRQTDLHLAMRNADAPDEKVSNIARELEAGKMTDNARRFLADAFINGGLEGMLDSARQLNGLLYDERSRYSLSIHARAGQDHIDIGVALTTREENAPEILEDLIRNGYRSPHYNRGMLIRLEPRQETPGQDV